MVVIFGDSVRKHTHNCVSSYTSYVINESKEKRVYKCHSSRCAWYHLFKVKIHNEGFTLLRVLTIQSKCNIRLLHTSNIRAAAQVASLIHRSEVLNNIYTFIGVKRVIFAVNSTDWSRITMRRALHGNSFTTGDRIEREVGCNRSVPGITCKAFIISFQT